MGGLTNFSVKLHQFSYIEIKEALRAADDTIELLEKENEEQRTKLEQPVAEQKSIYEEMMTAVEKQLDEWKNMLVAKDAKIDELTETNQEMHAQLVDLSMDTNRASVVALTKVRGKLAHDLTSPDTH
jgi:chromosome segregation ATPase